MTKLFVASDLHGELEKYEALVSHTNSSDIDAVVINGDFVNKTDPETGYDFVRVIGERRFKYVSNKERIQEFAQLSQIVSTIESNLQELDGDKEKLARLIVQGDRLEDKVKVVLLDALENHDENISKLEILGPEVEKEEAENIQRGLLEAVKYIEDKVKSVDEVLGKSKKPVYGVAGNHDPNFVYEIMKHVKFLDKTGSVDIKGVKIAGNPSTSEFLRGFEGLEQLYDHLYNYPGVKDENVSEFLKENPVDNTDLYQRLKDEPIDVLFLHKGVGDKMAPGQNGYDPVAYKLVKEKRVPVFCGHFHDSLISNVNDILGIRSGPDIAYEVDIDAESKRINYIDVYRFVKIGDVAQAA